MFLPEGVIAGFFADVDDFRLGPGLFEQMQINQTIMHDDVRFAETRQAPHCDQVWISWSRADKVDTSQRFHCVFCWHTKSSTICRRRRSAPAVSFAFNIVMISEFRIR